MTVTPLPEAREFIDPLLRDLPPNVREACRRWYLTGDRADNICADCGLSAEEFSEIRNTLRTRFARLREVAVRKPPVSASRVEALSVRASA